MDTTILVGLAVISAVIGLMVGLMISSGRKEEQTNQENSPPIRTGLSEVARIFSDGKKAFLQVQGKFVRSPDDLNPEQLAYVTRFIDQVRISIKLAAANAPADPPASPLDLAPSTNNSAPTTTNTPADPGLLPNLYTPPQRQNLGPVNILARAFQTEVKVKPAAPKSIAVQVDEILQEKIEGTPLEEKGIRLLEFPGKGMVVMVGLDQYSGVNDVPDDEIRNAIKAAVGEWEKRVTVS